MFPSIEKKFEEAETLSDDEIAKRLSAAGVEVRPDKAVKNNVGYLAKVRNEYGVYWQMARNVYLDMVDTGRI